MPEVEGSTLEMSTGRELKNQSGAYLNAGDAQSETAKIMYKYYLLISQKSNQSHQKFTEESSEQIVDNYDEKIKDIINESKLRVEMAQANMNELYKKYELENEDLNKAMADLRKKIALLREVSSLESL